MEAATTQSIIAIGSLLGGAAAVGGLIKGAPGAPETPELPALPTPEKVPELPVGTSGGVGTIAAAAAQRKKALQLASKSGAQSTVLSGAAPGGSLGAG